MPWKSARPFCPIYSSWYGSSVRTPSAGQFAEISAALGPEFGMAYVPEQGFDREHLEGFYNLGRRFANAASRYAPRSRPVVFAFSSSSGLATATTVRCSVFDALIVTPSLADAIHRISLRLAPHALETGIHRSASIARSLVNRLGHSRDTAHILAAFIMEAALMIVLLMQAARIANQHDRLLANGLVSRDALELDAQIQAISSAMRRSEGPGRVGFLLPGLTWAPFATWLAEERQRELWLSTLALGVLYVDDAAGRFSPAGHSSIVLALEAQHRVAAALGVRDPASVWNEALGALGLSQGIGIAHHRVDPLTLREIPLTRDERMRYWLKRAQIDYNERGAVSGLIAQHATEWIALWRAEGNNGRWAGTVEWWADFLDRDSHRRRTASA